MRSRASYSVESGGKREVSPEEWHTKQFIRFSLPESRAEKFFATWWQLCLKDQIGSS